MDLEAYAEDDIGFEVVCFVDGRVSLDAELVAEILGDIDLEKETDDGDSIGLPDHDAVDPVDMTAGDVLFPWQSCCYVAGMATDGCVEIEDIVHATQKDLKNETGSSRAILQCVAPSWEEKREHHRHYRKLYRPPRYSPHSWSLHWQLPV